jgi:serine/threonine-protein kinase
MRTCPECNRDFVSHERVCPDDGTLLKEKVPAEEQAIGRTLDGKYRIDGFLKRGGMGSVYRGTHLLLNKPVAIKLIRPELVTSHDVVERFFREARAAARLSHPNIVTVHDLGQTEDGTLYIAMEIVEGQSLKDVIVEGGPWNPARALRFCRGVASALSVAHRNGIVHRDLKPQNIMVCRDSEGNESPKLLDFGIAKTLEPDSPALTSTGMVLGTPHYMSAEQAKGLPADQRSDIYALGVILYEMLVGKVPFDDKSIPSILVKHLTESPKPPSSLRGDIPREVETLVLRCLEKDPQRRFQSADDLGKALADRLDTAGHPILDPTVATVPLHEQATVESLSAGLTGAGGASTARAASAPAAIPFPPPPPVESTRKMESGTIRAHEAPAAVPPPPQPARRGGSSAGLFVGLALVGILFLAMVAGGFILYRVLRGRAPEAEPVATASSDVADIPAPAPTEAEATTPPSEPPSEPEPALPAVTKPASESTSPPPAPVVERETPPPAPPPVTKKSFEKPRVEPSPPASSREAPPRTAPPPPVAAPVQEPIPEKPMVSFECEGVRDACGALRGAFSEAIEKRGMRVGRPERADVFVRAEAEEIEARTEEQFGNTFVIRTYSVTLDAEVPRFGDSVSLPPRTFSFDARLGREKLRGEVYVIATSAAERIDRYWEKKR